MNICFLCREYNNSVGHGGIGTFTYLIASALSEFGHKVFVVNISTEEKMYERNNIIIYSKKLFYIPLLPRILKLLRCEDFYLRLINAFSNYLALKNLIKMYKIDIIECPDWFAEGLFVKLIRKIPLVVRIHGTQKTIAKYLPIKEGNFWVDLIENIAIKQADGIIFPSKQFMFDANVKTRGKKYAIIYHPFQPPKEIIHIQKSKNILRIICVGRIEPRKNQEILIKALPLVLEKIRNLELVLIGRFPWKNYKEHLFSLIGKLKLKEYVKFIGELPWNEMYSWLLSSDIICVPTKYESFGYTFVEALSSGNPVIASDIPVFKEIVKGNDVCIFVDTNDHEKWAQQIVFLYENKELAKRLGEKAKSFIESEFSIKKIVTKCIDFYKEVISFYEKSGVS